MFNIEEYDNETTGNFVHVDLKQRQKKHDNRVIPEERPGQNSDRKLSTKRNSRITKNMFIKSPEKPKGIYSA